MKTSKGKVVRADFELVDADESGRTLRWEQRLEGTPFGHLLSSATTTVSLEPAAEGTRVTIELRQKLTGFLPRFGSFMVRRAAAATIEEALDGLERISG
jgi:carbon monoxide dehydrogenase subunit G